MVRVGYGGKQNLFEDRGRVKALGPNSTAIHFFRSSATTKQPKRYSNILDNSLKGIPISWIPHKTLTNSTSGVKSEQIASFTQNWPAFRGWTRRRSSSPSRFGEAGNVVVWCVVYCSVFRSASGTTCIADCTSLLLSPAGARVEKLLPVGYCPVSCQLHCLRL